jgi:hypothetical protein
MFFKYVKHLDVPIISLRREAWDYIMWLYKINVREFRRGNQKWIIQRYWQHRVHNKQDEENKTKTQPNKCWTPLCANKNTNNVNRTWAIILTTGGKDELNHHFCVEIVTDITTLNCERKDRRVCCYVYFYWKYWFILCVLWLSNWILELFWRCGNYCFSFDFNSCLFYATLIPPTNNLIADLFNLAKTH